MVSLIVQNNRQQLLILLKHKYCGVKGYRYKVANLNSIEKVTVFASDVDKGGKNDIEG